MSAQAASARQAAAGSGARQQRVAGERDPVRGRVLRPPERLAVVPVVVRDPDPSRFDAGDGVVAAVEHVALQRDPVGADVGVEADAAGVVDHVAAHHGSVVEGRALGGGEVDAAAVGDRPHRVEHEVALHAQAARRLAPDSRVRHVVDLVVGHRRVRRAFDGDADGAAVVDADVVHPVVLDAVAGAGSAHLHAAAGDVLDHVAAHRVARAHAGQDQREPAQVGEAAALDADPLGAAERDLARHPDDALATGVEPAPDDLREAGRPARGQPGRVGEGQPSERHVVERGAGRSRAYEQPLQDRGDDRYAPRILPPTRQVVQDMAARPGAIEVPAPWLAKQAEAVLDVGGSGGHKPWRLRLVCLREIAQARLVDGDQAPLRVAADAGDATAGLRIRQPFLAAVEDELDVLGALPGLRHGVAGGVAGRHPDRLAGKAAAARGPLRAPAADEQLAGLEVADVRTPGAGDVRRPAPAGDAATAADDDALASSCPVAVGLVDHAVAVLT